MAKPIPTPVRVARWAALAAATTALGSFVNTMWTSTPWWVARKDEMRAAAEAVADASVTNGDEVMMTMAAAAPDPSLYEKSLLYIQHNNVSVALMVGCGVLIIFSAIMEYRHRKTGSMFRATPERQ